MDNLLAKRCEQIATQSGIDGRTCYFAGVLRSGVDVVHLLQDSTRLEARHIERLLEGFASERYADYLERRALGSLIDSFGEQLSQVFMLRVFDVDTIC